MSDKILHIRKVTDTVECMKKRMGAADKLRDAITPTPPRFTRGSLARKLGITPQAVSAWMMRASKPGEIFRARLRELIGIQETDWDEE